jgi:outer membrane protein assembly factor BamB
VLVGSYDEHLHCVSRSTGRLLWKFRTEGPVHCTPSVAADTAFISGCDGFFRAVGVADGREMYRIDTGGYAGASPALGLDFAWFGNFDNEVLGLNLVARKIAWRFVDAERQFPFYASAALAEGRIIVGGRDKMVRCLDAGTGRELWNFATRARVESSAAISGKRVFVGSNDGRFYVLDLATGRRLWEFNAGAPLSASPGVAFGRIVIGSQDGRLYCFGARAAQSRTRR